MARGGEAAGVRDGAPAYATDRELAVVEALLATGSEKAAAHRLGLSHSTVKHHLAKARSRVGVTTTVQLVWFLGPRLPEPEDTHRPAKRAAPRCSCECRGQRQRQRRPRRLRKRGRRQAIGDLGRGRAAWHWPAVPGSATLRSRAEHPQWSRYPVGSGRERRHGGWTNAQQEDRSGRRPSSQRGSSHRCSRPQRWPSSRQRTDRDATLSGQAK